MDIAADPVTVKPSYLKFPFTPFYQHKAYAHGEFKGRYVRRDGSVVELDGGVGKMERFWNLIPNYHYYGPLLLILLVLSWGGRAIVTCRQKGESLEIPVLLTSLGILAVLALYWHWSTTLSVLN